MENIKNKGSAEKFAGMLVTINKNKSIERENNIEVETKRSYFFFSKVNKYAPNPHPSKADEIAINAKWYQSKAEKILVSKTSNIRPVNAIEKIPIKTEGFGFINNLLIFRFIVI